jgi:ribosome-associated protein
VEADLDVTAALRIGSDELSWRFSRSSGPGGQGVNTTDSRVELSWDAIGSAALTGLPETVRERALERLAARSVEGVVTIAASEFRSQLRNRDAARTRLAALVREAVAAPPPARRPTRPSRGSQLRRLEGKKRRSQVKRLRRGEE